MGLLLSSFRSFEVNTPPSANVTSMKLVGSVCGTTIALPDRAELDAVITVMSVAVPLASDIAPVLGVNVVEGFTDFNFTTAPSKLGVPLPASNVMMTLESRCVKWSGIYELVRFTGFCAGFPCIKSLFL